MPSHNHSRDPNRSNDPEQLDAEAFIRAVQAGDSDFTQLGSSLEQLKQTAFGRRFAQEAEGAGDNTAVQAVLSGRLRVSTIEDTEAEWYGKQGPSNETYADNLAIRAAIVRRITENTGYQFEVSAIGPILRNAARNILEKRRGIHIDAEGRKRIEIQVPDKIPPTVYIVPDQWLAPDEVVLQRDTSPPPNFAAIPGHGIVIFRRQYTVYKGRQLQGRLHFTELTNHDTVHGGKAVHTAVTAEPMPLPDSLNQGVRSNEYIFLDPQSPYLQPAPFRQRPTD